MGETSVRRAFWTLAILVAGVASGSAMLRGQTVPQSPLPAQIPPSAKVYTPTITPMPGTPAQNSTPNGNITPVRGVVPASASNPGMLAPAIMTSPPLAGTPRSTSGMQAPCVQIEKRGPDVALVNEPLRYEIIIRNPGANPVTQVRVEDEIPAGLRLVTTEPPSETPGNRPSWSFATLEPFAEKRIRVEIQAPGEGELQTRATVTFSGSATVKTLVVQPKLSLAMRGPEQVATGDPVPFQIQASNTGGVPIAGVTLRSRLTDGLHHPNGSMIEADLGTINPGETRTVTLTTTATRGGQQTCDVIGVAGGIDVVARAAVQVAEATVQLRRSGPTRCYLKSEIGFELEATNPGTANANDVVVTELLPTGFEYVMASDGGHFDPNARTITWRCPSLQAGAKRMMSYRVRATSVGEFTDRATIRADRGSEARTESTFLIEGVAAMSLEVVDLDDPIEVGGELTYEVRVVNQGSCACSNIQIVVTAPEGLQIREGAGPTSHRLERSQLAFDALSRLATKADAVYRIKVRGLQPGDYRFRVQMTCDQLKLPVVKEESSRVY